MNLQNYEKLNIDIQSYGDSNQQKIPQSAVDMIRKVKDYLKSDEIKHVFKRAGFSETEMIDFKYQGSYNEETSNDYFRIIDKSDIDLIMVLNRFTQNTPVIINNPENNKDIKDWTGFISKHISDSFETLSCPWPSHTTNYVEIYKFKLLKDLIFESLKIKFPQYFFENRSKVIKIGLDKEFHSHNIELILGGNLQLHLYQPDMNLKLGRFLKENKILEEIAANHFAINGYNLITSEKVSGRRNYYKEIPNFSNVNILNLKSRGKLFLKYVIFYKNFIKIGNAKRGHLFKIDISSFHIESLLYNLDPYLFICNVSETRLRKINIELLKMVETEEKYLGLREINEIFAISRNTNYIQIKKAVEFLNKAGNLEGDH